MSASYFLSRHVHVCVAGKQVVLLDLEHDKYLAIARAQPLARWVSGWPVPLAESAAAESAIAAAVSAEEGEPATPERGLLARMISQGLLVTDPTVGKDAAPVSVPQARVAAVEFDMNVRPRATFAQLRHCFTAYMAARWELKHRPIKQVVHAASQRKERAAAIPNPGIGMLRALVTAFVHLRPWFFTVQDACLLDSLTLIHFLAGYRLFPQWIFGVKTDPFYAHCWVQQGDIVCNDTPDHIRGFTPILVV